MRGRPISAGCAIFGGTILLLAPLVLTAYPVGRLTRYYELLILIAPLFLVIGLGGYYRAYASEYSLAGKIGVWLLGVGVLCFVPIAAHGTVVTYTLSTGVLLIALAYVGGGLAQAGTIGIAFDAWKTSTPSKWMALWLPWALPATAVSIYVGALELGLFRVGWFYYTGLFGLAWLGLGYHILGAADTNQSGEKIE